MINILPDIKKSIAKPNIKTNLWYANDAHPITGKVSNYLESQFTAEYKPAVTKYAENKQPFDEPNVKHAHPALLALADTDHLSRDRRGIADKAKLSMKPIRDGLIKSRSYRHTQDTNSAVLLFRMINNLHIPMDLFVQKKLSMLCTEVQPFHHCTKIVAGETLEEGKDHVDQVTFFFSTLKRSTVTTTSRQQIKDFCFNTIDQIGLEIELSNGRLLCTKVLPGCQASSLELQLDGAEVIAVNDQRVVDLEEFQFAMQEAKTSSESIILKVASYKGGKGKLDELYLHDAKKTEQVKSLFSNILKGGNNGGRTFDFSSSDEEGDEEDEVSTPSRKQYSMSNSVNSRRSADGSSNNSSRRRLSSEGHKLPDDNLPAAIEVATGAWEHLEAYPDVPPIDRPGFVVDEQGDERGSLRAGKNRRKSDDNSTLGKSRRKSVDDDSRTVTSYDSSESWNQLTKLEDIYPFKTVVCAPPALQKSEFWGDPRKLFQVSNYSTKWTVQLYWINENGTFIDKGEVYNGDAVSQLCSVDHVWGIATTMKVKNAKRSDASVVEGNSLASVEGTSVAVSSCVDESDSPALLLFRPNAAALASNKCTSVLWSPWKSASVTQRLYSQQKDNENVGLLSRHDLDPYSQSDPPHLHIQVFDGPGESSSKNAFGSISGGSMTHVSTTGSPNQYKLDKVKLVKWPRKKNTRYSYS